MWLGDLFDDACSFLADKVSDTVDFVQENPGKALVIGVATIGTGGAAAYLVGPALGASSVMSGLIAGGSLGSTGLAAGAGGSIGGSVASAIAKSALATASESAMTTAAARAIGGVALANLTQSAVDNVFRDKVKPVKGSIIYCDLAMLAEHSGVYLGGGKIAHLDGSGRVEIVTTKTFLKRLGGWNPAMSIYVSCDEDGAVGSEAIAQRARAAVGMYRDYNLLLDNCHQFASGCISGKFENSNNFLWMLKDTAEKAMNANTWRVWVIPENAMFSG